MLAAALALFLAPSSFAGIGLSITIGPPALPVYQQPVCPGEGYIWTPGYWAWGDEDYYWVPGTWTLAPEPGLLWTPGYWGWGGGVYVFHAGYWGPTIGFYGGINYGFGYTGRGYAGGRWDNGHFFYNRSVNNINVVTVTNVYTTRVVNETRYGRTSYNGGRGGIEARATTEELSAEHERHVGPLPEQTRHAEGARGNPLLRASANHGRPPIAATQRPGEFNSHAKDIRPASHDAPPNAGNPALDQRHQRDQQSLVARQDQERQRLQARQESDHQRLEKSKAADAQRQQMEQNHTRQTQQLMQPHAQQQQNLAAKHQKGRHR